MDCSAPSNPLINFARVPMDSATPDEQLVIDLSLQAVKRAIAESKAAILALRPSDEYAAALGALEAAQRALDTL
jgi:hypothetical protein